MHRSHLCWASAAAGPLAANSKAVFVLQILQLVKFDLTVSDGLELKQIL